MFRSLVPHTCALRRPADDGTSTQFALDCAPTFHTLYLYRMWPLLPASRTSVTELKCVCKTSRDWLRCQDVVRSCRLLQRLKLEFGPDYVDMATDPNVRATLTLVVHLELWQVGERNVAAICRFLAHFDMPNLSSLSINPRDRKVEAHADLYESLVRGLFPIYLVVSRCIHRGINFLASVPLWYTRAWDISRPTRRHCKS